MGRTLCIVAALVALLLAACSDGGVGGDSAGTGMGRVTGTVLTPLESSHVYAYQKGMDLYGPAFAISEATGPAGDFDLTLPDGEYTLVVRKRESGDTAGPVLAGDHKSDFISVVVKGGKTQLELLAPLKVGDSRRLTEQSEATTTGLSGLVSDMDGRPVEGARVHVYDHVQMSERPKYVSEKTGPDGRYLITLPEGGTYYLAARDKFGGPPKLGDLYGRYDQGTIEPSAVVVRGGEILEKVDIRVAKVW